MIQLEDVVANCTNEWGAIVVAIVTDASESVESSTSAWSKIPFNRVS